MKKITFLTFTVLALVASLIGCTPTNYRVDSLDNLSIPSTTVFVQGHLIDDFVATKTYNWPEVHLEQGWAVARYSLRADNTTPDYLDHPSDSYYGRSPGKQGRNRGEIYTGYPYGHYNDRNYDYYKRDKTTGSNVGLFRYVFDTKGLQTQKAIKYAPKVEDILADEVDDITTMINEGKTVDSRGRNLQEKLNHINSILAHSSEYLNSHILWYVVKEVGMKDGWHVNGVISDKKVGYPNNTPDNIEIDIHQQEHLDWSEIKTSIHIRANVGSIEISIPLNESDIVEANEFTTRVWKDYDVECVPAVITVNHDEKGATFIISEIDYSVIERYKNSFGDGLTVEISTFTKSVDPEGVWDKVKNSTVTSIEKPSTVVGQITSAYFDEKNVIKVMSPNGKNGSSF